MTVLLGLWFSLAIGVSDYFGGYVTRRSHAFATVANAAMAGTVVAAVMLVVVPSEYDSRSLLMGLASGAALGFALSAMYRGLTLSSAAVVSPIVAVLAAAIPVGWDVATGGAMPGLAVLGAAVAMIGLVFTTVSAVCHPFPAPLSSVLAPTAGALGCCSGRAERRSLHVSISLLSTAKRSPQISISWLMRLRIIPVLTSSVAVSTSGIR